MLCSLCQAGRSGALILTGPLEWFQLVEGPVQFLGLAELNQD